MVIPLVGFGGKPIAALNQIDMSVTFSEGPSARTKSITFDIANIPYQYNAILGRATLNTFGTKKLPGPRGIITIRGNQDLACHTKLEAMAHVQHVHMVEQNSVEPAATKYVPKAKPKGDLKRASLSKEYLTKTTPSARTSH